MWLCLWIALIAEQPISAAPDFDTQVMPVLTKAGCNSGACHGAAVGRGGFRLSLYGSRPAADFAEITLALEGRRIDRVHSDLSLLLLKPTEQINHEGGTRLSSDGEDIQILQRWIEHGAMRSGTRKLLEWHLTSHKLDAAAVTGDGSVQSQFQLVSEASFSDGTNVDVLPWTVLTPNDATAISISSTGEATIMRPGRHLLMARFLDQVRPVEFIVPFGSPERNTSQHSSPQSIDDFVDERLAHLGLQATGVANDYTFIRRVTLDLTGRIPSSVAVLEFAADRTQDKRIRLVDDLLQTKEFVDFWGHRMAMLLRVGQVKGNATAAHAYYDWIRSNVRDNVSWTEVGQQLLNVEGPVVNRGAASFYNVASDARGQAELVSQVLLGVRIQCANCHDHPLDAWTQDDYHGMAAVFARIKRGDVIRVGASGEVIHPSTGEPAVPKIPGGPFLTSQSNHRMVLADWITSADNPYFAKAFVNRVWSHLLGRGLVDPVDDLRTTNPPTHPELLDWLVQDFAAHDTQLRHLIRRICTSQTYARNSASGAESAIYTEFYASAHSRPLSPEVLLDAMKDATASRAAASSPSRAVTFKGITESLKSLEALGRCTDFCESPVVNRSDLTVQLQLLNGAEMHHMLTDPDGFLAEAVRSIGEVDGFIMNAYLRLFSRPPRDEEMAFWRSQLPETAQENRFYEVAQDMLWSLLNSDEFCTNH